MAKRILRAHVGRPIDFASSQASDAPLNGVIEQVKRGVATVRYYVVRDRDGNQRAHSPEGFVAYIDARSERIQEIY